MSGTGPGTRLAAGRKTPPCAQEIPIPVCFSQWTHRHPFTDRLNECPGGAPSGAILVFDGDSHDSSGAPRAPWATSGRRLWLSDWGSSQYGGGRASPAPPGASPAPRRGGVTVPPQPQLPHLPCFLCNHPVLDSSGLCLAWLGVCDPRHNIYLDFAVETLFQGRDGRCAE